MCGMCPDYVTYCMYCSEGGEVDTRGYPKRRIGFYLGGKLCEHIEEKYGTNDSSLYTHILIEHEWGAYSSWELPPDRLACEDRCIDNEWWPVELVETVVENFARYGSWDYWQANNYL